MSENCIRGSDPPMAGQGQIKPAPHAVAGDRRVNRSRETFDRIHQTLTHLGKLQSRWTTQSRNFVEIRPRGKEFLISRDDQCLDLTGQRLQRVSKFQNACSRQPVHAVIRLKAQYVNAIDLFDT